MDTSYVPWEMSEQGVNYFDKVYKNNPLSQIYTGNTPLLNPKQFVPFYRDMDLTQEERDINYLTRGGYTYPGGEDLYIRDLDEAGRVAHPDEAAKLLADAQLIANNKAPLAAEKRAEYNRFSLEQLQQFYDDESAQIAKVGTHETIHGNIFDKDIGMYPNAIAEMLRGTSALGVPQGTNRYLGKRGYGGGPDRSIYPGHQGYTPRFEQDELFTQWLTGKFTDGEDSMNHINASLPYMLYRDMDRPAVGPLGQEGIERLLEEKGMPFYNQLISDSEAGYVQDSIWNTLSSEENRDINNQRQINKSILSSEENIDINNQRQNELDERAALVKKFAQIEKGRHAVAIEDPIDYKMNADNSATMPYTHYNSRAANYAANVRPDYYFKD